MTETWDWKEPAAPARKPPQERALYDEVGGEEGLKRLIETFYDIIEFEPMGERLHLLHLRGHGVAHSRVEQFNFLSQFFGGPRLYSEKHHHASIRLMHEHVEIDAQSRDDWLACMSEAIDRVGLGAPVKDQLMAHFTRVAAILVNR